MGALEERVHEGALEELAPGGAQVARNRTEPAETKVSRTGPAEMKVSWAESTSGGAQVPQTLVGARVPLTLVGARVPLTLVGALESWTEPAGKLESTCEESLQEGAGEV